MPIPFNSLTRYHYLKPSNYYAKSFASDFSMWFHAHDYIEIMYCDSGSFVFEINRDEQVVFSKTIRPGELVMITNDVYHKILTPDPCEIINIEFEICQGTDDVYSFDMQYLLSMSKGLKNIAAEPNGYAVIKSATDLRETLLSLIKILSLDSENFEDKLLSKLLVYQLFTLIGKSNSLSDEKIGIVYIRRALKYIHLNLFGELTVKNIAKEVGVSPSYLQRLFREHYQTHVYAYISSKRLEYAKDLLTNSQLPYKKIALSSGFHTYNQFLYVFKKMTGLSPGEYRKTAKNNKIDYAHADRGKYTAIPPKKPNP
ncbi:MAG: AraC family transcriptional regulator [Clostridiales bacterium]|jgi:AraC-like DNA-binding protein|nr:AraC family transcriptional regulator [Clostridiales bacterium]